MKKLKIVDTSFKVFNKLVCNNQQAFSVIYWIFCLCSIEWWSNSIFSMYFLFSLGTWCSSSSWMFLIWIDISWSSLFIRILNLIKCIWSCEANNALKKRAGIYHISCILILREVLRYCFVIVLVWIFFCWCLSIKSAKLRLL